MRILLATDLSAQTEQARSLVARLSKTAGSVVRVVHAIEPLTTVTAAGSMPILDLGADADRADRESALEVEKFAACLRSSTCSVEVDVLFGRAPDVIIAEAERFGADLVIVGSRGRGSIASLFLGSVSAEVVDRAPCPVLVARGATLTRILLAEDGSPPAAAGARVIARLPALRSLPVRVVSVLDLPLPYVVEDPFAAAAVDEYAKRLPERRAECQRLVTQRANELSMVGIAASTETREGDAAAEIVAAARADASDLIVVGSHGQTGLTRLLLGSVARSVLFHAPCSVLVVHAPTPIRVGSRAGDADRVAIAT